MSKVIHSCFGVALLHFSVIGLKISRHFLIQSEIEPKQVATRSDTFSRALYGLHAIGLSFDWFTELTAFFMIGQSGDFGFSFRYSMENYSKTFFSRK